MTVPAGLIVPEAVLADLRSRSGDLLEAWRGGVPASTHRHHLEYALLVQHRDRFAELGSISDLTAWYTSLLHFHVFVDREQALRGADAGLEQQAQQLLEQAPAGADWQVVSDLLAAARN